MVELMLGILLLGMLLVVLFTIFERGWAAWRQANTRNDLSNQSRQAVDSLTRELEASVYESVSLGPESVSFLSARDDDGQPVLDAAGNILWQRFVLYYRDPATRRMLRCEEPVPGGLAAPTTIEAHTGTPLTNHLAPDRLIATDVERFDLAVPPASRRLELEVVVEMAQRGGLPPATMSVQSGVSFRNR